MYLAIAQRTLQQGHWPTTDPYLYSIPGDAWTILHQWLSYFIFYGVYSLGGFNLIILFKVALLLGIASLPLWRRKFSTEMLFFWGVSAILAFQASLFRLMERSSLFSEGAAALLLVILLHQQKIRSRGRWALPVLFFLWIQLHPSFPLGWGLLALWTLSEWRKGQKQFLENILLLSLCIGVCFLNPRGWEGVLYPFQFMQDYGATYRQYYFEWYSTLHPLFLSQTTTWYLFALMALSLFLFLKSWRERTLFEGLAAAMMMAYGLNAIRFIPMSAFILTILNTYWASQIHWRKSFQKAALVVAFLALSIAVKNGVWGYETIAGHRTVEWGLDSKVVPVKATEFLEQQKISGAIFNTHLFGSYLAWKWQGQPPIFYHGFVTHPDFFVKDYMGFSRTSEEFASLVNRYHISAFIVDRFRNEEPLIKNILSDPEWKLAYRDEGSLVFLRQE